MSISSRITEIETHIGNTYDKLEDLGVDLTNVDKNINNISSMLDTVWNGYPKVTASNVEEATLNGTKKGRMQLDLKGNTFQNGEPTPEVPIPIQNVSGNNNIKIQNKNLFKFNDEIKTAGNTDLSYYDVTYSINNQILNLNGTINATNTFILSNLDIKAGTYTISFDVLSGTVSGALYVTVITENETKQITLENSNTNTQIVATGKIQKVTVYIGNGRVFSNYQIRCQLEEGTATTYVEHQEQNLPFTFAEGQKAMQGTTLQDDGIHNEYKQKIFDGSNDESWNLQSINANGIANFYIGLSDYSGRSQNLALVNYFTPQTTPIAQTTEEGFYLVSAKTLYIRIKSSTASTVAEFRTWLSTHNLLIEYELAEEEIIPYSETQQAQYNAIKQAKSYNGQTNISQTNDDLPFILDITALKK